jgi:hypothetical protein
MDTPHQPNRADFSRFRIAKWWASRHWKLMALCGAMTVVLYAIPSISSTSPSVERWLLSRSVTAPATSTSITLPVIIEGGAPPVTVTFRATNERLLYNKREIGRLRRHSIFCTVPTPKTAGGDAEPSLKAEETACDALRNQLTTQHGKSAMYYWPPIGYATLELARNDGMTIDRLKAFGTVPQRKAHVNPLGPIELTRVVLGRGATVAYIAALCLCAFMALVNPLIQLKRCVNRARHGQCLQCRYPLSTTADRCAECGLQTP